MSVHDCGNITLMCQYINAKGKYLASILDPLSVSVVHVLLGSAFKIVGGGGGGIPPGVFLSSCSLQFLLYSCMKYFILEFCNSCQVSKVTGREIFIATMSKWLWVPPS
jgi:hypothetical protein